MSNRIRAIMIDEREVSELTEVEYERKKMNGEGGMMVVSTGS
jgi:hypothetical protein